MNVQELIQYIQLNIKQNGVRQITGNMLQDILVEICNNIAPAEVSRPLRISDELPTTDGIYLALESGIYSNGIEVDLDEGINYLILKDGVWSKVVYPINFVPTGTVQKDNPNAVSGGEVFKTFTRGTVDIENTFAQKFANAVTGELTDSSNETTYTNVYDISNDSLTYRASGRVGSNVNTALAVYFDINNQYISSEYQSSGSAVIHDNSELHPPASAHYAYILGDSVIKNAEIITDGQDWIFATKEELKDLKEGVSEINQYNFLEKVNIGGVNETTGAVSYTTQRVRTDFINLPENFILDIKINEESELQFQNIVFFNENNTRVGAVGSASFTAGQKTYINTVTNPSYKKMIISLRRIDSAGNDITETQIDNTTIDIYLGINTSLCEQKEDIDVIKKNEIFKTEVPIKKYFGQYADNSNGNMVQSTSIEIESNEYNIQQGKRYFASGYMGSSSNVALAVYYNDSGFDYAEYLSLGTSKEVKDIEIFPKETAKKVMIIGRRGYTEASLKSLSENSSLIEDSRYFVPQIKNNPLPKKDISEPIKILCFGSSWFMDTWWYLNKITESLGINADLWCFYTGSARFDLWLNAYNGGTTVNCWRSTNGSDWTSSAQNFKNVLSQNDWDIIAFQQGARQARFWDDWHSWSEITSMVKRHCNQNTSIVFNSTWTPAYNDDVEMVPYPPTQEGKRMWQNANYKHTKRFLYLSGIDIVIPNGSMMWGLRASELNNATDLATDGLHPDNGLPVYALGANFFQTVFASIYNVDISDSTWLPDETTQKATVSGSTFVPINLSDKSAIEDIIKLAHSDRFGFVSE